MGKDIGKRIFIEFIGLPASGKTTLSHVVADKLRLKGYNVSEPNYDIVHGHNGIGRVLCKLMQFLRFRFENPVDYKQIKQIICNNAYHGISARKHLLNLILKIGVYQHFNNGIMVWDQGIYQAIISLSITGAHNCIKNEQDLLRCNLINRSIVKFFLDTPVDVAMQRMANRKDGKSRIEKIANTNDRRRAMMAFDDCCKSLLDEKTLFINGLLSIEEQAGVILEKIQPLIEQG